MDLNTAIEDGKRAVVRHVFLNLQGETEVINLAVKRRHEAIQKATSMYICWYIGLVYALFGWY